MSITRWSEEEKFRSLPHFCYKWPMGNNLQITCNLLKTNTDLSATEYNPPSPRLLEVLWCRQLAYLVKKQSFTNLTPVIFPASSFHFQFQIASVRIRQGKQTHTSQHHGENLIQKTSDNCVRRAERAMGERRSNLQLRNCKKLLPPLGLTNKGRT